MRRLMTLCLLTAALGAGCTSEDAVIPFVIVTPEGQDTFAGVVEVRAVFGDKEKRTSLSSSADSFELKLNLPTGESGSVLLEGLDGAGDVLCRGRSPQLLSVGSSQTLTLYVARLGTFGRAPSPAPVAAVGMAQADYRVEDWDGLDDDVSATLFFGGVTADGSAVAAPFYYDTYFHTTYDLTATSAPRTGLTAMNIDGGYFLLFGGRDAEGQLTGRLDLLQPGAYDFEYANDLDYGLEDTAREGAPVGMIGPYPSLLETTSVRLMNSFLVVGGAGPSGPRCDALHLVAKYDLSSYLWTVDGERRDLVACRQGHTVTMTKVTSGTDTERVAFIYGGASSAGDPVAEVIRLSPTQVDVDTVDWGWDSGAVADATGPMVTGHAALTLEDGRVLVVGGETADGTLLADGWLYDPSNDQMTALPGLLQVARTGHTATRIGDELIVAGGTDADGAPLGNAEIFDLSGDTPTYVDAVPLTTARTGHHAFRMPTGTLGLLGGVAAQGSPIDIIEIYTPGLVE